MEIGFFLEIIAGIFLYRAFKEEQPLLKRNYEKNSFIFLIVGVSFQFIEEITEAYISLIAGTTLIIGSGMYPVIKLPLWLHYAPMIVGIMLFIFIIYLIYRNIRE
jgi:hypothetical protein